jgi:transposase-like protein
MTATLDEIVKRKPAEVTAEQQAAVELVRLAKEGARSTTVLTGTTGPVAIDLPRDRAGTFEPQSVNDGDAAQGRVDEMVLSL